MLDNTVSAQWLIFDLVDDVRRGVETAVIATRGGLGAVMGSKRLKAIVFDHQGGRKPPIADPKAFREAKKAFSKSYATTAVPSPPTTSPAANLLAQKKLAANICAICC